MLPPENSKPPESTKRLHAHAQVWHTCSHQSCSTGLHVHCLKSPRSPVHSSQPLFSTVLPLNKHPPPPVHPFITAPPSPLPSHPPQTQPRQEGTPPNPPPPTRSVAPDARAVRAQPLSRRWCFTIMHSLYLWDTHDSHPLQPQSPLRALQQRF